MGDFHKLYESQIQLPANASFSHAELNGIPKWKLDFWSPNQLHYQARIEGNTLIFNTGVSAANYYGLRLMIGVLVVVAIIMTLFALVVGASWDALVPAGILGFGAIILVGREFTFRSFHRHAFRVFCRELGLTPPPEA